VAVQAVMYNSDEAKKASSAAAEHKAVGSKPTIFSKIIDKSLPATILHEDELVRFLIRDFR